MAIFAKEKEGIMLTKLLASILLLFLALFPVHNKLQAQNFYIDEAVFVHGAEAIVTFLREQSPWDPSQFEIRARMVRTLGNPAHKGNEMIKNQLLACMQEGFKRFASRRNVELSYWRVRAEAALALGRIGDPSVASEIVRLALYDDDTQVRMSAIRALGMLKNNDVVPTLIDILYRESVNRIANELVLALGEIGDKRAFPILLSYTMRSTDSTVQYNALQSIKRLRWQ
jgi:HEAT repeat protein